MSRIIGKSGFVLAGLSAGVVSAALVMGITASGEASAATKKIILATTKEITLASSAQALAYCQAGKMSAGDIAYIAGPAGMAQFAQDSDCVQQVPTKTAVTKSIQVVGKRVSECTLTTAKKAIEFCQNGGVGEWDIDYVSGKVGKTLSGPGYGCVVNYSTSTIGNAICR